MNAGFRETNNLTRRARQARKVFHSPRTLLAFRAACQQTRRMTSHEKFVPMAFSATSHSRKAMHHDWKFGAPCNQRPNKQRAPHRVSMPNETEFPARTRLFPRQRVRQSIAHSGLRPGPNCGGNETKLGSLSRSGVASSVDAASAGMVSRL